jgi:hypothetical protein
MITSSQFTRSCGCRSAGECTHGTFVEPEAFNALVDAFAEAMKRKFLLKWAAGRDGWDDPANEAGIREAIIEHAKRGQGQEVDTANLAAMAWNFGQP